MPPWDIDWRQLLRARCVEDSFACTFCHIRMRSRVCQARSTREHHLSPLSRGFHLTSRDSTLFTQSRNSTSAQRLNGYVVIQVDADADIRHVGRGSGIALVAQPTVKIECTRQDVCLVDKDHACARV
jgi:hypothetical protein